MQREYLASNITFQPTDIVTATYASTSQPVHLTDSQSTINRSLGLWGAVCIKTSFFKVFVYLLQYLYIDCNICISTALFVYSLCLLYIDRYIYYIDHYISILTVTFVYLPCVDNKKLRK